MHAGTGRVLGLLADAKISFVGSVRGFREASHDQGSCTLVPRILLSGIGARRSELSIGGASTDLARIVFTFVGTRPDGRPDAGPWTRLVLWLLKISGEPWLWSIKPDALGHFMVEYGWTIAPNLPGSSDRHGMEFFGVAVNPIVA